MNDIYQLASLRKKAERALAAVKESNDPAQRLLNLAIFDDVLREATKLANRIVNEQNGNGEGSQDAGQI